jgi:hypothetical protein
MPRIKTETKTVYTLAELEGTARETALNKLAEWATSDDFWHESVIDDAKTIGALMGIEIKDIFFSGFSSQGDGACFTGTYSYKKGALKAVKEYAPQDAELHRIAAELQKIEARNFYRLTASITKRSHHYSHDRTVEVDTDEGNIPADMGDKGELAETLRDYMQWIYKRLEDEYEYQTSEEQLLEMAEANGYEFTEDGRIA